MDVDCACPVLLQQREKKNGSEKNSDWRAAEHFAEVMRTTAISPCYTRRGTWPGTLT